LRKTLHVFLHGLSLVTLVWIGWAVLLAVQKPSIGAYWAYQSGVVYGIDAGHPSAKVFQIGDRILQGGESSLLDLYKLTGKTNGQSIPVQVERNGQIQELIVQVAPSSLTAILDRLPPFLAALGFWLAGTYVLAFSRSGNPATLFFLLSQSAVMALTCGAISVYGPFWTQFGFHLGILWLGAFAVHLHLVFPARVVWQNKRRAGYALVITTTLLSLIYFIVNILGIGLLPSSFLWALTSAIFGIDMILVVSTLVQSYRKSSSALERHQVGIITLSSLFGIIPVVALILIPQVILGYPMVSSEMAFIALSAIPVGYWFAIYRYKLIGVKQTINRGMAIILVALVITAIYSFWFSISTKFISPTISQSPIWGLLTTTILAGITVKLYGILMRFVNNVLYGGWYDYRSVVEEARHSFISTELDRESVGATLCQVIGQSMRLETVSLVLPGGTKLTYEDKLPLQTERIPPDRCDDFVKQSEILAGDGEGLQILDSGPDPVFQKYDGKNSTLPQHLVLLRNKDALTLGILLLGQKRDGEPLNTADFDILKVVIHQAQVTLENARLLEEVQKYSEKVGRLHRQVLRGREEERKRLARDLHDLIIQSLVGVNYQIAEIKVGVDGQIEEGMSETQSQIQELIGELRQICADLRPPTLDVLDFIEAIQTKVAEIEENANFRTRVFIEGNEEQEISEEVRLCIYRLIQESLINVHKHAQADHVEVWIQVTSEQVTVMVTDNGMGFEVPSRLEILVPDKHYGLIGLKEMVEAVDGNLNINSKPGQGCILAAHIPI
jgi:signal transduction histidine kinase